MDDLITYMGYEWIQPDDDGVITIGINEEGLDEFAEIIAANLPSEDEKVTPDGICGELETDQGPMNIYSPVRGTVTEVNEAISENPELILEDCYGDGWLIKIEADRPEDVERLSLPGGADDDFEDEDES